LRQFKLYFTAIIIFLSGSVLQAQETIFDNEPVKREVEKCIDHIYNLEFTKANSMIIQLERALDEEPALYLLRAFYTYWKDKPLKKGNPDYDQFERYLEKTLELSNAILDQNEEDEEASFFKMAAHAYLALLYLENGENLKSVGEAKVAYDYVIDGFELVDKYPEYYFPCGIYNYYREKYPEEHPLFKSLVWVFRSGDMEEGLQMLNKGARQAVFTRVECLNYLAHIHLHYEGNYGTSIKYGRQLYQKYPNNPTFIALLSEAYMRQHQYSLAKPLNTALMESEVEYYVYVGHVLHGIYLEKHERKHQSAMQYLRRADALGARLDMRSPHFDSQLYFCMGRIYYESSNKEQARDHFKKALREVEYNQFEKEIEDALELVD